MQGEALPGRSDNHVAFQIDAADKMMMLQQIEALGLVAEWGRDRVAGEGRSIYSRDRDNHLCELHTGNLTDRLQSDAILSAQ